MSDKTMGVPLRVSRWHKLKRDVDRDAKALKRQGGKNIRVSGKRGGPWVVRATIYISAFAKFCSDEARRESRR